MAGLDKKLTDLTELASPTDNAWIHVVEPSDISQSPEGSSFKVKKSNFGGLSDAPSDGETYGRKDGAWEIVSGNVLTTNTNITSSSLTTQDVAGFVAYINGLVSSFSVAANEIRTYTVTDTGQKFEILLRGRSFGGSEPDITSNDVLEIHTISNRTQIIQFAFIGGNFGANTGWYRINNGSSNSKYGFTFNQVPTVTDSNNFNDDFLFAFHETLMFNGKIKAITIDQNNNGVTWNCELVFRNFQLSSPYNSGVAGSGVTNNQIIGRKTFSVGASSASTRTFWIPTTDFYDLTLTKNSVIRPYFRSQGVANSNWQNVIITILIQEL